MLSHYSPEKNLGQILMKEKIMNLEIEQNLDYFEGVDIK